MTDRAFWSGKKVVVTAGPTREPLDPVRFLTNASSGRMGHALAREARRRGARVTLISGPVALRPPRGVRVVPVGTAREMLRAAWRHGRAADVFVGAAAVADWRPAAPARRKIKKGTAVKKTLRLLPNPDILMTMARRRRGPSPRLVGFALETDNFVPNARRKLIEKSLELIVANAPDALDRATTRAWLLEKSGKTTRFAGGTKTALARRVFAILERTLPS